MSLTTRLTARCMHNYDHGLVARVFFSVFRIRNWQLANVPHWQMAHYHGSVVGHNMVCGPDDLKSANSVPFFWTQHYGKSLRYSGKLLGKSSEFYHRSDAVLRFFYRFVQMFLRCFGSGMVTLLFPVFDFSAQKTMEVLYQATILGWV